MAAGFSQYINPHRLNKLGWGHAGMNKYSYTNIYCQLHRYS